MFTLTRIKDIPLNHKLQWYTRWLLYATGIFSIIRRYTEAPTEAKIMAGDFIHKDEVHIAVSSDMGYDILELRLIGFIFCYSEYFQQEQFSIIETFDRLHPASLHIRLSFCLPSLTLTHLRFQTARHRSQLQNLLLKYVRSTMQPLFWNWIYGRESLRFMRLHGVTKSWYTVTCK